MKTVILVIAMLTFSTALYAAPLGIREIELGMHKDQAMELLLKHKEIKCYERHCKENAFIIRPATFTYSFGKEVNKLLSITIEFRPMNYAAMLQGMVDKYGPPHETKNEIWMNKAGTQLENIVSEWHMDDGALIVKKLGSNMDTSEIAMLSKYISDEIQIKKDQDKKLPGF
jgi:hypothetical protein